MMSARLARLLNTHSRRTGRWCRNIEISDDFQKAFEAWLLSEGTGGQDPSIKEESIQLEIVRSSEMDR